MADKVKEILEKFAALSQQEKDLISEMDAAFKEYNDYCVSSDNDLNAKIEEIQVKMKKLDYYIDYAREHAQSSNLEDALEPFETSEGHLESIRQTIKLESHNDVNAETLYTKATGQKMFYQQKIEQTRQLIEGSKVQAKRQYDSDLAALNLKKDKHDEEVRGYIESLEFKDYLRMLAVDKSAFNSTGTAKLSDHSYISLGQRRIKLSVPMEIEQDLSLTSNGEYNSAAHTIGAPLHISMERGSVLYLDYDEKNKQYLFGGIQRMLLNIIKYFGQEITDVLFCEPENNSPECLGTLAELAKGVNPFIVMPDDVEGKLMEICSRIDGRPTEKVSRVVVLHGFPESYSFTVKDKILNLCRKAADSGAIVVLTHNSENAETDLEKEIRSGSLSVRSRNGGFWIEQHRESFFWYSAPSDLPEEVRRIYVEQRRAAAAQAAQAAAPAPTVSVAAAQAAPVTSAQPKQFAAEPAYIAPEPEPVQDPWAQEPVSEPTAYQPAPATEPDPVPDVVEAAVTAPVPEASGKTYEPVVPKAPERASEPAVPRAPERAPEPAVPRAPERASEPAVPKTPERAPEPTTPRVSEAPKTPEAPKAPEPAASHRQQTKGKRILPGVEIGKDKILDISGNITYLCGSRSEERRKLTDLIISKITVDTHPDDAELWIFDCGGDLMRYAENPAPHIRYLVSDSSSESARDLADMLDGELISRSALFRENGWRGMSAVPASEYMPHIVVVINEFAPFLESYSAGPKLFGRNYADKISRLFRSCADYGIHFVLIGETFSENGGRPECFRSCEIRSAVAVTNRDAAIGELFSDFNLLDNELESLKKVPMNCAFMASASGLVLVRIYAKTAESESVYTAGKEYSTDFESYVDKNPLIIDRQTPNEFAARIEQREKIIAEREPDEMLLFLGEPCRLASDYPVRLMNGYGENVLMIAPAREKKTAVAVVLAALQSLCEQGIPAEILAFRSNPVYAELMRLGAPAGLDIYEDDAAVKRVREISAAIPEGKSGNSFKIILGGDVMMAQMHSEECTADLRRVLIRGSRLGSHFMFVTSGVSQMSSGFTALFRHRVVLPCQTADAEKVLRDAECALPENGFRFSDEYDELTFIPYIM